METVKRRIYFYVLRKVPQMISVVGRFKWTLYKLQLLKPEANVLQDELAPEKCFSAEESRINKPLQREMLHNIQKVYDAYLQYERCPEKWRR